MQILPLLTQTWATRQMPLKMLLARTPLMLPLGPALVISLPSLLLLQVTVMLL